MTDPAATLNRLGYRADREIDRLTAPLAAAASDAVARHAAEQPDGTSVITPFARLLILRDVDEAIRGVYGAYRGDRRAPMYGAIAAAAASGHATAYNAAIADMHARLAHEPELRRALEGKR